MTWKTENPAGRATGGAIECLADVHEYSTYSTDIKRHFRISYLRRQYGLTGPRAALIARLHFDGGRS